MAYSDFTLDKVLRQFAVRYAARELFPDLRPAVAPEWLAATLARGRQTATTSEKARSEFIVTPILLAAKELAGGTVALFSGERLTVDRDSGLDGECDYLLSLITRDFPVLQVIQKPVLCMVEAKKNDIESGLGQCAAQMVAAQRWNAGEEAGHNAGEDGRREVIHGCVTTGETWQFLRLDAANELTLDERRLYLSDLPAVLAALLAACGIVHPRGATSGV